MRSFIAGIVLFLFVSDCGKAQTWCAPGAVWNYKYSSKMNNYKGYTEIRYVGDTVISGRPCNKLYYQRYQSLIVPFYPPLQPVYDYIYTYQDNGVTYFKRGFRDFDTLFNLNSPIGKGWRTNFFHSTACKDPYPRDTSFTVVDTGHVLINGFSLKYLTIWPGDSASALGTTIQPQGFSIVERIGYVNNFFHPYPYGCQTVTDLDAYEGVFTCYWDDHFPVYHNPQYLGCNYNITGLSDHEPIQVTGYPNPGHGVYTIKLQDRQFDYKIFDTYGRIIEEKSLNFESATIDLLKHPPGLYFLQISSGNHSEVETLVKLPD